MSQSPHQSAVAGFASGTCIATDRGEVAVEDLVGGERILTMDHGYQKLLWSGPTAPPRAKDRHPALIRIATGNDGVDLPRRSLMLGRGHRVLLTGISVAFHTGEHEAFAIAEHLPGTDARGCEQTGPGAALHHLLLRDHEVILANGIWCESVFGDTLWFETLPSRLRRTLRDRLESPHDQTARACLARHETVAIHTPSPKADDLAA